MAHGRSVSGMAEELSNIDLKILEQIQKNSSISTAELADRVGLS